MNKHHILMTNLTICNIYLIVVINANDSPSKQHTLPQYQIKVPQQFALYVNYYQYMNSENSIEQRRKIQVLQYLNSTLGDLIQNGFNFSPAIIETFNKKKIQDIQQIQQLNQLSVGHLNLSLHKQDKGSYKRISYEQITLDKCKNISSLTMNSERSDLLSSSYDKKLQTMAKGVKIIVKVKRN